MPDATIASIEAQHGEKMIEVRLRFWTNDIAAEPGHIVPKHAWSSGAVRMQANRAHGIGESDPVPFHSLLDIGSVIEKVLIQNGITLHLSRRAFKYITPELPNQGPKKALNDSHPPTGNQ